MKESFLRKVEICKKGEGLNDKIKGCFNRTNIYFVLKGEKRL